MTDTSQAAAPAEAPSDAFASMFSGADGAAAASPATPAAEQAISPVTGLPIQPDAQSQPQTQLDPAQQGQQKPAPMVPLSEVQKARARAQEAEQQNQGLAAQLAQLATLMTEQQKAILQQSQPKPPQAAPLQVPDPRQDPLGYMQFQQLIERADRSEEIARIKYSDDVVDKAVKWAQEQGTAQNYATRSRHPYVDLVKDYNAAQVRSTYGNDPDAVERAVLAKFNIDYDALKGRVAQSAMPVAAAQQSPVIPPSLAQVGPGSMTNAVTPDPVAFFSAVMNPAHTKRPRF